MQRKGTSDFKILNALLIPYTITKYMLMCNTCSIVYSKESSREEESPSASVSGGCYKQLREMRLY